jgi:hypothetical protein
MKIIYCATLILLFSIENSFSASTNSFAATNAIYIVKLLFLMFIAILFYLIRIIIKRIKKYSKENKTRICPFCAEKIKFNAVICKHCGKNSNADINNIPIDIKNDAEKCNNDDNDDYKKPKIEPFLRGL